MAEYVAKTALSIAPDEKKPWKTRLVRAGETIDSEKLGMSDEHIESLLERGGLVEPDEDGAASADDGSVPTGRVPDPENPDPRDDVVLPERPSNGASTDAWRSYADQLNAVTSTEMDPMEIPADAKRDQLIAITDQRLKDWNED